MKRCYQCDGRFGLIRHRFGLKQFCSKPCLLEFRAHNDRKNHPIKREGRIHEKAEYPLHTPVPFAAQDGAGPHVRDTPN